MIATIPENGLEGKVCQHLSLGLLQDVLPVSQIEELLETYQMWEQREKKLNMVAMVYWLIGLHLYPHLSQRAVYAKLVSGQRALRDDVAQSIPVKSAFSYRREQLGSDFMEELFATVARRQRGQLLGGAAGRELVQEADAWMTDQGIHNPVRWSAMYAPGFP